MTNARASDMLIAIWSFCEPEDREAFVTYLAIGGYLQFQAKASEDNGATGSDIETPTDSMTGEASRSIVGGDTDEADRDAGNKPTCALTPRDDITVGTNSPSSPVPTPRTETKATGAAETPNHSAPVVASQAASNSEPKLNPHCQRPETCALAHSMASCSKCANDAMKARAA